MTFREQVGRNIKKVRENLGLTQTEVAKRAGMSANYFAKIEWGEINTSLDKLHKIVKELNAKSSDIFPS